MRRECLSGRSQQLKLQALDEADKHRDCGGQLRVTHDSREHQ